MSQSSPEGFILGKGSKLVSLDLSIDGEKVLTTKQKDIYTKEETMEIAKKAYNKALSSVGFSEIKFGLWFDKWFKNEMG